MIFYYYPWVSENIYILVDWQIKQWVKQSLSHSSYFTIIVILNSGSPFFNPEGMLGTC